jgi:hypothetical protein
MENSTNSTQTSPIELQLPSESDLSINNFTQPLPTPQSAINTNYWKIATGLLGLVVVIGGLAFGYTVMKKPATQIATTESTPAAHAMALVTPTPTSATPTDQTANWKTFNNNVLTFKYPSDLSYKETSPGFFNFTLQSGGQALDLDFRVQGPLIDFDTAVKNAELSMKVTKQQNITNGLEIIGTSLDRSGIPSGLQLKKAYIKSGQGAIVLESIGNTVSEDTFNQILSTLKVIN